MKIVMLSGKQGAGKSTISDALKEKWFELDHKNKVKQMKFADVIYEMHDAIIAILEKYLPPRNLIKDGPLLQLLGTEWGRKTLGPDVWVDVLKARLSLIPNYENDYSLVIIDDCRFENEFDAVPEALRVRLRAEEGERKKRCSMWRENTNHPSETGLDDYAIKGLFDVYLNTDSETVEHCVSVIFDQIYKNSWIDKRIHGGLKR
jgi:hypothetical protein